ncbi:MAG: methyltransferase [Novosphingobium sp.]
MASSAPPLIFSPSRRVAVRRRMLRMQLAADAPRYLLEDMVVDVAERIAFLRHEPRNVLAIGDLGMVGAALASPDCTVTGHDPATGFDQEQPYPIGGFDTIVSLGTLDTANDLPGALIHLRQAATADGLLLASFVAAGSLENLRAAMLAADGDRPAPRMHPVVDVRAAGQLLQRAGWRDPVVDVRSLQVRYSGLDSLVNDLRAQGLTNALARPGPALTRSQISVIREQFEPGTVETFEILTLTGRR